MREIDPEVAALLDDLPRSTLPDALVEQGWGRRTMAQELVASRGALVKPTDDQQPIYAMHCVQCGRPVTRGRRGLTDHAGDVQCDGAITDDQAMPCHCDAEGYENALEARKRSDEARRSARQAVDARRHLLMQREEDRYKNLLITQLYAGQPCSATKPSHHCAHQCSQDRADHFGFHECKHCRQLWR